MIKVTKTLVILKLLTRELANGPESGPRVVAAEMVINQRAQSSPSRLESRQLIPEAENGDIAQEACSLEIRRENAGKKTQPEIAGSDGSWRGKVREHCCFYREFYNCLPL